MNLGKAIREGCRIGDMPEAGDTSQHAQCVGGAQGHGDLTACSVAGDKEHGPHVRCDRDTS